MSTSARPDSTSRRRALRDLSTVKASYLRVIALRHFDRATGDILTDTDQEFLYLDEGRPVAIVGLVPRRGATIACAEHFTARLKDLASREIYELALPLRPNGPKPHYR